MQKFLHDSVSEKPELNTKIYKEFVFSKRKKKKGITYHKYKGMNTDGIFFINSLTW